MKSAYWGHLDKDTDAYLLSLRIYRSIGYRHTSVPFLEQLDY